MKLGTAKGRMAGEGLSNINVTRLVRRQRSSHEDSKMKIHVATFSEYDSKFKVTRSKSMVWCEKVCHKEYTCEIWKPYLSRFISYEVFEK